MKFLLKCNGLKSIFKNRLIFEDDYSNGHPKSISMKKFFPFFSALLLFASSLSAQDVIRQQSCHDDLIMKQVDSLKQLFAKEGFEVLREASMTMESEYEMPVIVPLQQGAWYQMVFIGDITSRLYEVRMFDYQERQVAYHKKMWVDIDGDIISYR